MQINEISPTLLKRAVQRFNKIDSRDHSTEPYSSHPEWVKGLTVGDRQYREKIIAELQDEGIWDKTVNLTDSKGMDRDLTITLVQRKGDVLELLFSIDYDFVKPKYKNRTQDTKLAIASMKLVLKETVRILHTLRPPRLKFSAVLTDRNGKPQLQGESRAGLYDRMVSAAAPYLQQIGYSVDKTENKSITYNTRGIEWLLTRVDKKD